MVVEIQPEDFISGELKMESGELSAQQNAQLLAINPLLSNSQLSTLKTQLTPCLLYTSGCRHLRCINQFVSDAP